jgi:hypothetical protein
MTRAAATTMSPLARAIYRILRRRVRLAEPRVTYKDLAEQLRDQADDFEHIHHRGRELYAALGEIGRECRRLKLPPLPALVVRADTKRPGEAYYSGGFYKGERIAAWRKDLEAVRRASYPALNPS